MLKKEISDSYEIGILKELIKFRGEYFFYDWERIEKIPEFCKLKECNQNPKWHSEGSAFIHTKMVCNEALKSLTYKDYDKLDTYVFLAAALFHDIGKGVTTKLNKSGNWCSHGHDIEGEKITRRLLWNIDIRIREKICLLVKCHMKPLVIWERSDQLGEIMNVLNTGVDPDMLCELKRCDQRGSIVDKDYDIYEDFAKIDLFEEWSQKLIPISDELIKSGGKIYKKESLMLDRYIYVMIGLPGSGKNTFIDECFNKPGYRQISRDDIRAELGYCKPEEKYLGNDDEEGKVTQVFNKKLLDTVESGDIAILNNTNLKKKYRDEYKRIVGNKYNIHWKYIYIQAETIEENKKRRAGQIPDGVFYDMMGKIEMPEIGECETFKIFISRNNRFDEICIER